MTEISGVAAGTRVLTPNPLSTRGEGARIALAVGISTHKPLSTRGEGAQVSPSPLMGKGPGDGARNEPQNSTNEQLAPGVLSPFQRAGKGSLYGVNDVQPKSDDARKSLSRHSPSPHVGKGLGDGARVGRSMFTPIESLKPGDLVLTHRSRYTPVKSMETHDYVGEIVRLSVSGAQCHLLLTPKHRVATLLPDVPEPAASVSTARKLRSGATRTEEHLWQLIRGKSTGVKFRRQHRIGPFIVDFYSPQIRLVIEVDGGYHCIAEQREYDQYRQGLIEDYDVAFVRLTNLQVLESGRIPGEITDMVRIRIEDCWYKIRWLAADCIKPGMMLHTSVYDKPRRVLEVDRTCTQLTIFDLSVEDDESYFTDSCALQSSREMATSSSKHDT